MNTKAAAWLMAVWGLLSWTESASAVGGNVFAWGYNSFGECNVPGGLTDAIDVSCGNYFSMALRANGTIATWGDNAFGLRNVPAPATDVVAIGTRGYFALALQRNGSEPVVAAYERHGCCLRCAAVYRINHVGTGNS